MAVKNYLFYSAEVDENSGAQSSVLNLYSDANGTPLTTGTLIASYAGSGPNLGVEEVGGEVRPNKTAWTETMSGAGGTLEVAVADAGTGSAEIRFTYGGTEMRFDASRLAFTRSTNYPSLYAYNRDRAAAEPAGAWYTSSITSAAAVGFDSVWIEGTLDPAAESFSLRWREGGGSEILGQIPLTGAAADIFPIQINGLRAETTYSFEIVSTGSRGASVSAAVSATTGAAPILAVPLFEIVDTDNAAVKRAMITDVAGAAYFDLQIAAGDDFTDAETIRVTNVGGAAVFLRDWPESETGAYSVRVRSASGSDPRLNSAWSEPAAVQVDPAEGEPAVSGAEMAIYSNLAIHAAPTSPHHAATVSKVSELISDSVGALVSSVGGHTGAVTTAQLAASAAADGVLVVQSSDAAPNPNNSSVITASSTDAQVASAKAVYHYVRNVRSTLSSLIADHRHSYLYAFGSDMILAAPTLDGDGTIVPDAALAPPFDPSATYQPNAVVAQEGFLYQNTSGTASTGNADFASKWTRVTAAELIAQAGGAGGGSAAARYETDFFGADLDQDRAITITHNLGERFVSVELIDMTADVGTPVISALINLTSANALKLTFSEGLPAARQIKAIVRA